ncbi:hypothetical protein [Marivita sp. XM-24bin2]|uniref:hypothetical protein n=1 Tax=Marivita sp. XM-24bin2 TaxID=2133951 RepID=UPI0025BF35DE|nr:hypothetical protein [Marivita sp. XM-24bin2]
MTRPTSTPPQIATISASLPRTGARPFADTVAATLATLGVGQPLGAGETQLAEHGKHGHEDEEEDNDL